MNLDTLKFVVSTNVRTKNKFMMSNKWMTCAKVMENLFSTIVTYHHEWLCDTVKDWSRITHWEIIGRIKIHQRSFILDHWMSCIRYVVGLNKDVIRQNVIVQDIFIFRLYITLQILFWVEDSHQYLRREVHSSSRRCVLSCQNIRQWG